MMGGRCALVWLLALPTGCALLTKSEPIVPRYFTPESDLLAQSPTTQPTTGDAIRLGHIGGASYLKERIAYRTGAHELGFYEAQRWAERPEQYLQRALERTLFEEQRLVRSLSSSAPVLTADLVEFEEVRGAQARVRVGVRYSLRDDQTVLRERSIVVERSLATGPDSTRGDRMAAALGQALREAARLIAEEATSELRRAASAPSARPSLNAR